MNVIFSSNIAKAPVALLLFIISAAAGCSSGRPAPILSTFECKSDLVESQLMSKSNSSDPQVTKLTIRGQTVFATTIIECDVRDYVPTRATSRQLLSGFENLVIQSEGYVNQSADSNKTLYLIYGTAEIDKRPIDIMAASSRAKECVTDSVFWRDASSKNQTSLRDLVSPVLECVK